MCLGIPGRVAETFREDDLLMGTADFGGVRKRVCLEHVPEVRPGDYVVVHVGFALSVIDEAEATRVFALLEELGELEELRTGADDGAADGDGPDRMQGRPADADGKAGQ
ncbi:HypC/HybG/HupF family hydrogenase formation chaperone [Alienimonas sp. DA493]|uniref:HypC/HybG/HupF family hydrogenase formation chaperone n=1 Tax=Alienimonas sp. DA493 TaxID=3373605 RepID=UPI0037542C34